MCVGAWAVLLAVLAGAGPTRATGSVEAFTTEEVSWTNGDVRLTGTLCLPATTGRCPAALFIHGSGNMGRSNQRGNQVFHEHARHLASRGIATLIYDKRGVGASTGRWQEATFDQLSGDAAAGIELLRRHPRIDGRRIGILGLSQGSWISLTTSARAGGVQWIVWITGAAVSPARQEEHVVRSRLRAAQFDTRAEEAALRLLRDAQAVYRSGAGWDRLATQAAAAEREPWFKAARIGIATQQQSWWRWYASFMDYDPRPALERLHAPLFAAFAENDELVDSVESAAVLAEIKARTQGDITTRTYPACRHGFRKPDGSIDVPAAYWSDLDAFVSATNPGGS